MAFKLIPYGNTAPIIDQQAYIADNCSIIGAVLIGQGSSVWFNSVLRGDVASINIGQNTNIQDGTIIHTSRFNGPVQIGDNVTVGHCCLIHACTIRNNAFIGMRSTIMDYCIVEEQAFVAAGSLLTPNTIVKSKELWMGSPARFARYLTEADLEMMQSNSDHYVTLAVHYLGDRV